MNILEEIQNCPVEWKVLKDVAILKNGKDWKTLPSGEVPVYGSGGEMGEFVSDYSYDKPTVLIPRKGSISNLFYIEKAFWNVDTIYYTEIDENQIIPKYFYYYLTTVKLEEMATNPTRPSLTQAILDKVKIPIPPLKIQEKIVQTLDKFTDYVTELTSRKKQYSYYRDKLLSFEDEVYQVEWKTIQDISVKIVTGVTPKKSCEDYYLKGTIPWLRTNEVKFNTITTTEKYVTEKAVEETGLKWILPNSIIIAISGATAGRVAMNSIPLTTNQHCCSISVDERIVNYKYLYYWLVNQNRQILSLKQGARGDINMSMIKSLKIPVPSLEIQSRIVQVLDNFDTVCNDLNIGLPKEIELRQKQYEYFREKLLTFVAEGEYTESRVEEWDNSAIIKLLQWVFGPIRVKVGAVAEYSQKRISVTDLTPETYVGVDNLLQDRKGKAVATFLPDQGSVTTYNQGDILIGNIRPYLKKIWFSNQVGGTSGDVLTIQNSITPCMENKYLYYILSDDRFFYYNVQYSKGSKMPRGDKKAIMQYKFILPSITEQKRIVSILDNFNTLTNSLSEGLPKEIELRQKQYEYWREQLLNFTR
ncbi:restriction endonuclease subunit S [Streptococcus sp. D2]|nr:restriction endonuclease subunit S [Streptococcus sp. D2]